MKKKGLFIVAGLLAAPPLPPGAAGQEEPVVSLAVDAEERDRCAVDLAKLGLTFDPDPELPTGDPCDLSGAVEVAAGAGGAR